MLVLQKLKRYTLALYRNNTRVSICLNNLRIFIIYNYKRQYAMIDMKIMNYYTIEYSSRPLAGVVIHYRYNKKMNTVRMSDTEISVSKTTLLQGSYNYHRMHISN